MATINAPKPARREELREDQLATAYVRTATFFEEHRRPLIIGAVALALLIAAVAGWRVWQERQDQQAAEALGAVLTQYEAGEYRAALDGADGEPGLLEIADRYGSTNTGQLATFFAADALYQLGEYDQAATYFERYDASDDLLGASALAGQAALAERAGEHAEAADLYTRAAGAYASAATAPDYFAAAARAHEAAGDLAAARASLEQLRDDYEESPAAQAVELELARLTALEATGGPTVEAAPAAPAPPADSTTTPNPTGTAPAPAAAPAAGTTGVTSGE